MGLQQFITKVCAQTAVYWQPKDMRNETGDPLYEYPVEISVRWDINEEKVSFSRSRGLADAFRLEGATSILVTEDLIEGGFVWLGTLSDLETEVSPITLLKTNPKDIKNAYVIKKFKKTPEIFSTSKFVRSIEI